MTPYMLKEDTWRITSNKLSYVLEEYVSIGNGKHQWRPYGYYQTIDQLLRSYAELVTRQSDKNLPEALRDAVMDIRRISAELKLSPSENFE